MQYVFQYNIFKTMRFTKLLLFIACTLTNPIDVNSQVNCTTNKIIGEWCYFTAFNPVKNINIDSLKNLLPDTITSPPEITFLENGKCITKWKTKSEKMGVYKFDPLNCQIIYGKKKKPRYSSIATIEYLDEKCLIYTKWNHHGPVTIFYYRKLRS